MRASDLYPDRPSVRRGILLHVEIRKTLEDINVRALTKAFLAMRKTKRQKTTLRWENRLPATSGKWKQISQLYKYNFLTPRDS